LCTVQAVIIQIRPDLGCDLGVVALDLLLFDAQGRPLVARKPLPQSRQSFETPFQIIAVHQYASSLALKFNQRR
jgi:hypothetical protein